MRAEVEKLFALTAALACAASRLRSPTITLIGMFAIPRFKEPLI